MTVMQTRSQFSVPPPSVPFDPTAYAPATTFLGRPGVRTYKRLKGVLRRNPWIKTYSPRPYRLEIHAGDFHRFERGVDLNDIDVLDVAAGSAAEFEAAARAIRRDRLRRRAGGSFPG